jgi:predicted permease
MKKHLVTLDAIAVIISGICFIAYLFILDSNYPVFLFGLACAGGVLFIVWAYIRLHAPQKTPQGFGCVPGIVFANAGILHYHHLDIVFGGALRTLIFACFIMAVELAMVYYLIHFFRSNDSENDDHTGDKNDGTTLHEPLFQ